LLAGRIEEQGKARAMRKNTRNLSAYDFWLQGKYYLRDWKGSNEDIIKAREMFENAIELDADYAAAYAGLAGTYILEFENSWTDTPVETGQIALELARKAASLDDQDSWVHLVLALAYRDVKSDFELANAQVRTAIELNPNHYWNYCFKSWLSTCSGDLEEGIFCGNEAIRRNPLLPDGCLTSMVFAEYLSGRYDQAIETFGKMINPDFRVQACLAACYAQLGRHEDARRAAEEFRKCTGDKDKIELDENWNEFWSAMFKFKNPEAIDHLLEGMSKAGLPGE
jgi:tetratricopeptide (TPR) repeat protein